MGLSQSIITTGLVPPERVGAMIRAMDVLAHPSAREGLPRTVPQALLCGVCPVAYDVDGTGEACIEMRTGRLVPLGDLAALRSAIRWCCDNPDRRQALAAAGREVCERDFSVGAMVDGLEAQYARAIDAARRAVRGERS
jgi:glycosyltransferase involved in cell wall biosynthesis